MKRIRLKAEDRRAQMVEAGVVLARQYGIKALTRVALAAETGTTDGLVNRYFGSRTGLREAIIVEGVARKDAHIVAWALKDGYQLEGVPRELMREAARLQPSLLQ